MVNWTLKCVCHWMYCFSVFRVFCLFSVYCERMPGVCCALVLRGGHWACEHMVRVCVPMWPNALLSGFKYTFLGLFTRCGPVVTSVRPPAANKFETWARRTRRQNKQSNQNYCFKMLKRAYRIGYHINQMQISALKSTPLDSVVGALITAGNHYYFILKSQYINKSKSNGKTSNKICSDW